MTVSRVMRNAPAVAPATREAVLRAAADVGYRPDPLLAAWAAAFRTGARQTRAIAFLTSSETAWRDAPDQVAMFEGAQGRARELGWHLIPVWSGQAGAARLHRVLQAQGVEGLLIGGRPHQASLLRLEWSHYAVAALGHSLARPVFHRVASNHLQSVQMAARELARRGYRRVGLAMSQSEDRRFGSHLLSGYLGMQASLPQARRVPPFFPPSGCASEAALRRWLERETPDAVLLGASFRQAAYWLAAPGGPGVVCLGRAPEGFHTAYVARNFTGLGRAALERVVAQLHGNERGIPLQPTTLLLDALWVEGPTVRPRR